MSEAIEVRIRDTVRSGRALTVTESVDPRSIVRAIRGDASDDITVVAAEPGPVHRHVGYLHPAMGLRTKTALAAAARTRAIETPYDEELSTTRDAREELPPPSEANRRESLRRAVAAETDETEALREAVAAARGRLLARREAGLDPAPAAAELSDAIAELSEIETSATAARQRLERNRENARQQRDVREERFRLEDRIANLERKARAHLVRQVEDEYVRQLETVPGVDDISDPYSGDALTRALAVARIAELSAPVVVSCDRFETADEAAAWLDAPVVRI